MSPQLAKDGNVNWMRFAPMLSITLKFAPTLSITLKFPRDGMSLYLPLMERIQSKFSRRVGQFLGDKPQRAERCLALVNIP